MNAGAVRAGDTPAAATVIETGNCCLTGDCCCPAQGECCDPAARGAISGVKYVKKAGGGCCATGDCCCPGQGACCGVTAASSEGTSCCSAATQRKEDYCTK
jgi:hypothetical protein